MYKPFLETFFAKSKLLYHPNARRVLRANIDLNSMQGKVVKKVVNSQGNRVGSDVSARIFLGNPVANGRRGDRAVQNVGNVELTNQLPLIQNYEG